MLEVGFNLRGIEPLSCGRLKINDSRFCVNKFLQKVVRQLVAGALFISQRLDGIEARSTNGRVYAKDQTHRSRHAE